MALMLTKKLHIEFFKKRSYLLVLLEKAVDKKGRRSQLTA
jgi:hypothetical protein